MVEGREVDGYLYDKVCEATFAPSRTQWRVLRADELAGPGNGGKQVLLNFFDYLRNCRSLQTKGAYTTLFCLDKDVDDVQRRQRSSLHVLYTTMYDIEGQVIQEADLKDCAAAAMSLPRSQMGHLAPTAVWLREAERLWAEWVALCLTCRRLGLPHADYGRLSVVNNPPNGPTDPLQVEKLLIAISAATGLSLADVRKRFNYRLQRFLAKVATGDGAVLFKGKWYFDILLADLVARFNPSQNRRRGLREALVTSVIQSVDVLDAWSADLRRALAERAAAV